MTQVASSRLNESRLQELRSADPKAYLAELAAAGDQRWELELRELDPDGYRQFVTDKISKLHAEAKLIPSHELNKLHQAYYRLSGLDPKNREFQQKRNHPLRTAGMTGYVCTPGASPAGIPSRRW
jgi:hypothetical protein